MGIETLYADRIEANIKRWTDNPGPAPSPASFGAWSFLTAGAKGPVAGGLESAGTTADALSLFAAPAAATFGAMDTSGAVDQAGVEAARQKVLNNQAFDPAAGDALRRKADTFMPDPATSSRADQTIAGLTRGVTKAAADIAVLGPAAGAVAFGLDEGNTAGQRLRMEGVDTGTALKVAAVTGVTSAVGAALPMGGSNLLKTTALALTGGPVTFMAQEALSKKILAEAGYNDQASMHDPLDPLGLALSTVIPFGFGALHLRGVAKRADAVASGKVPLEQMSSTERLGLKYDSPELDAYAVKAAEANGVPPAVLLAVKNAGEKSGSTQVSPKGAQGVMQFMPATAKEVGITDPRDPMQSIAGGAAYLRKLYDAYGSWDAAVAHYNGGGSQAALVRGGAKPSFPETAKYLERVQQYMQDHAVKTGSADPDVVDAARVQVTNAALHRSLPDAPNALSEVLRASDSIAAGEMPRVKPLTDYSDFFTGMEPKYDVPAASKGTMRMDERGMPEIRTEGISLTDAHPVSRMEHVADESNAGQQLTRFAIRDANDNVVGHTDLLLEDGKVVSLYDVETSQAHRNKGVGAKVVEAVTSLDPDRKIEISNIVDEAVPFWEKVGAQVSDGNRSPTLDWHQFAESPTGRSRGAARRGESMAEHPQAAGTGTDPGNARSPQGGEARELTAEEAAQFGFPDHGPPLGAPTNALPDPSQPTLKPLTKPGESGGEKSVASIDSQRVASIVEADPTLKVKLPGSDETMTVADALERAKAEAKQEAGYSKLIDAAAKCFLSFGA